MGWAVGPQCFQTVAEAAAAGCLALDDNPDQSWQWCGPLEQTGFDPQTVISVNEAAGTASLRMHTDAGQNPAHTVTFSHCELIDAAYLDPALDAFELAFAIVVGAVFLMRMFARPRA